MNEGRHSTSEYTKTYTSFSGCDIVATFNDRIIGELQGITYSVSREKAPVYTMGSAEPRSFSRGKRGIAGTLVFTVFDRDSLIEALKGSTVQKFRANIDPSNRFTIDEWNTAMEQSVPGGVGPQTAVSSLTEAAPAFYADELPPFDITISFANEYGQQAVQVIYGVEILNEGTGFSIDSITTEKACTFVARRVEPMQSPPSHQE